MFKKKIKEEPKEIEEVEEEKEPELINKDVPNPRVAITVVRSAIIHHVLCICNIDKQERHDIATCVDYLLDYLTEPVEFRISDSLQEQIDEGTLGNYTKTYEDNGYEITLTIKKTAKK